MQTVWQSLVVPLLWLIGSLGFMVAIVAIFKAFNWLMERLDNLD